ncbi:hypothetical protein CASFOL_036602 [Castilleja foliolosa]|uniref:Uncharacterized protein n=1 Tax=Castilleja foliolosa TaxID=1961234 RepID=A0ABD3BRB7_9LAMI
MGGDLAGQQLRLKDGSAATRSGESPISTKTPAPRELHTAWRGLAAEMVVRCLTGATGAAHLAPKIGGAAEVMGFI